MQIFDSHTHLNDPAYARKEDACVAAAHALGVDEMAIVGSDTTLNAGAVQLAARYPGLVAIVGWHPESAKDYTPAAAAELRTQLALPQTVAIGEIGLDYHWDTSPRAVQRRVFVQQLALADELDMPVSIHSRDAFMDTYTLLNNSQIRRFGGVMHSFTGDAVWARRFLALGMYVSFSGIVSFKNAAPEHDAVRVVPDDRLLVETDAPYLTPEPYRGQTNQPGFTRYVVEAVARLRGTTPEHIAAVTQANAHRLFGLGN